jgi:hypothetical protein
MSMDGLRNELYRARDVSTASVRASQRREYLSWNVEIYDVCRPAQLC